MIKFGRELLSNVFDEMMPLFDKHYKEIAHYQDIPLDPIKDEYMAREKAGAVRAFIARDEYGAIVGYAVFFVCRNLHYRSSLQALQDVLFIDPAKRGFGMKFIAWCDEQLKAEGIQVSYHHVKKEHNFGPLLERLGYDLVDLIYARRLD